jgi:hypothetical protein
MLLNSNQISNYIKESDFSNVLKLESIYRQLKLKKLMLDLLFIQTKHTLILRVMLKYLQ